MNNAHTLYVVGLQNSNNMVEKKYENKSLTTKSSLSCKIHFPTNVRMKKKKSPDTL